jgi:small GTP-binding protein
MPSSMETRHDANRVVRVVKGVLIGDFGVGKSSLMQHRSRGHGRGRGNGQQETRHNPPSPFHPISPTIGVDFHTRTHVVAGGTTVKLNVWDTAGQERFRSVVRVYLRGADVYFLVFSVTSRPSFDSLAGWLSFVRESVRDEQHGAAAMVVLLANKVDHPESEWAVPRTEIEAFAAEHACEGVHYTTARRREAVVELLVPLSPAADADTRADARTDVDRVFQTVLESMLRDANAAAAAAKPVQPSSADVMATLGFRNTTRTTPTSSSSGWGNAASELKRCC